MDVSSVEATRAGGAASRAGRLSGEITIAAALFLTGLLVFFLRQPAGIVDAMRLALPDSDDAMRLLGVRDLLAGQGWLDPHQYRYLAPDGVAMHWSRLVDAPLAGGFLALTPLLGAALAERVVVTTWPILLFVAYAGVLLWGGARLFGARAGGLAVLVAAQMVVFGDLFAAGRIDHHNIQVILVTLAAIGFGLASQSRHGALLSGLASALSLAVGLETMPVIVMVGCGFALLWIIRGADAARPFLSFSAGLAIAAPLLFAAQTAPSQWTATACDALSAPWLIVVTGEGLVGAALVAATPRLRSRPSRLATALALGSVSLLVFALAAPMCLQGPYGVVSGPYRSLWLRDILEAYSFQRFLMVNPSPAIQSVAPMLLGAMAASIGAWRARSGERPILALLAAVLWLGVMLAQFQIRTVYITSAVLPLAAGWFVDRVLASAAERRPLFERVVAGLCALGLFGLTWAGGIAIAETFVRGDAKAGSPAIACRDPANVVPLAALKPGVVLSQADLGPNILVHTPHSIVVAGYHRGAPGIVAGIEAFTGSEDAMRNVIDKFRVDYLVICSSLLDRTKESFARELADGRSVDWLSPQEAPAAWLKVWRVARDR